MKQEVPGTDFSTDMNVTLPTPEKSFHHSSGCSGWSKTIRYIRPVTDVFRLAIHWAEVVVSCALELILLCYM